MHTQYNLTLQHGLQIASILTSHEIVLLLNPTDTSSGLFKTRIRFLILYRRSLISSSTSH